MPLPRLRPGPQPRRWVLLLSRHQQWQRPQPCRCRRARRSLSRHRRCNTHHLLLLLLLLLRLLLSWWPLPRCCPIHTPWSDPCYLPPHRRRPCGAPYPRPARCTGRRTIGQQRLPPLRPRLRLPTSRPHDDWLLCLIQPCWLISPWRTRVRVQVRTMGRRQWIGPCVFRLCFDGCRMNHRSMNRYRQIHRHDRGFLLSLAVLSLFL